jgi:hypothetical protein
MVEADIDQHATKSVKHQSEREFVFNNNTEKRIDDSL